MPRIKKPQPCRCGCGEMTKGGWYIPGHDQKLRTAIENKVGGLEQLKRLVEQQLGCTIKGVL